MEKGEMDLSVLIIHENMKTASSKLGSLCRVQ